MVSRGKLTVIVGSATDIIDPSSQGSGKSFCTLRVGNQVSRTAVDKGGSSSPIFNTKFEFDIDESTNDLAISVYSKDINRDDQLIGYTTLKLKQVFSHGHTLPVTAFPLLVSPEKFRGCINISLTFKPVLDPIPDLYFQMTHHLEDEMDQGRQLSWDPLLQESFIGHVYRAPFIPPLKAYGDTFPKLKLVKPCLDGLGQAEDLWKTYVQCGEFEEFCSAHRIHGEDKIDMGRGRLTAALFPGAFCGHLAALMLASKASGAQDLPQCFKNASNFVLEDLPYAKNNLQTGVFQFFDEACHGEHAKNNLQTGVFQFFDEACHGEPVNLDVIVRLGGLIAIFQQLLPDSESNIEYCIVQHDLTGVYLCRRVEKFAFNEDWVMEKAIGVLGLETTSDDILVENVRHDGSYYSGNLEDFSYKFVLNKNGDVGRAVDNQCANRLFGHLKGAEFLAGKENGLKCSPLLAIALAIAMEGKNLALEWNVTHGHMDIKNLSLMGFENAKWQILYMDNINQLGFAVEWGMEQLVDSGASSSSHAQSKTSHSHCEENNSHDLQALASVFTAGGTQKRAIGVSITFPFGVGIGGSVEKYGSEGKALRKAAHARMMERLCRSSGRFVETKNLDTKHAYVKEYLLQGRLSDLPNNYLIVGDNVAHGHVSVYWADDEHGKCTWITDIMLPDAKSTLFKGKGRCLKGLLMKVERDGSKFVATDVPKSTSDLKALFTRHKKLDIIDGNMKLVPQGSHSNDEWVHLIGHHWEFSGNKFLWEATHMRAIVSSRTSFSSGALLETYVLNDKFGDIGYCIRGETDAPLVHCCVNVVAWGQFSRAPASLTSGANLIKWGGLIYEDLC